jgi:hypothetical protein
MACSAAQETAQAGRIPASAPRRASATDASRCAPAGGVIRFWSKPIEGEIRDDQGISLVNPDTGMFMRYRVAGAYDSNIALLLTKGDDRLASYQHLSRVLGTTSLRGQNVATNLEFHYGLVNWFIGQNVMAKPTTRFVVPYLTLVGQLKDEATKIDTVYAFLEMKKAYAKKVAAEAAADPSIGKAMSEVLDRKGTLLTRPMERLLEDPHLFAGWLPQPQELQAGGGRLVWLRTRSASQRHLPVPQRGAARSARRRGDLATTTTCCRRPSASPELRRSSG